jgi:hypothetical protein
MVRFPADTPCTAWPSWAQLLEVMRATEGIVEPSRPRGLDFNSIVHVFTVLCQRSFPRTKQPPFRRRPAAAATPFQGRHTPK